jgi:hypothetical protein
MLHVCCLSPSWTDIGRPIIQHLDEWKVVSIKDFRLVDFLNYITNLLGFIGFYKFCAKSGFHRFVQKSHSFMQNYITIIT